MPTYGYECTKCAHKFEVFHSMNSVEPRHCPRCEGLGKKLLSASSIIFKGSGFYTTDYRDSGYVEAQKRDSTTPSSTTAGSNAKPAETTVAPAASEKPTA
ncbi:MAG TPA: zinc ribbon domain-containing protein, partial [Candidatus Ozemobacteraceae bacterium]|nr:zinc ribbon domain-containing protein [Candidatus Ozemobacteraceae bacterium]